MTWLPKLAANTKVSGCPAPEGAVDELPLFVPVAVEPAPATPLSVACVWAAPDPDPAWWAQCPCESPPLADVVGEVEVVVVEVEPAEDPVEEPADVVEVEPVAPDAEEPTTGSNGADAALT